MPITEQDIWNSSPDRPIQTGGGSPWGMGSPATATGPSYSNPVATPGMSNPAVVYNPPAQPQVDHARILQEALARQQAQQQAALAQQQAAAEAARRQAEQVATAKKQQYVDTQTGLYNNYFNTQQSSQLAALKNARDTALQGFNGAERTANQTAYNNKNQVDASHAQSAQRLREIMASTGLLNSGDNVTQNLQLENQRASALNDINQSTGNILQDVTEKRNLAYNQAASQEQALADRISSDKTKALIDLQQYGDQKETDLNKFNYQQYVDTINNAFRQQQADIGNRLQEGQLTGQYNGNSTLAALNSARQDALARAGLTGSLDGQQTLQGRQQSWGQMTDMANMTGQLPNGMQTLQAQWADRNFNLQNKQANLDAALKYGAQDGRSYDPKQDWGLIRNSDAPQNLQGQQYLQQKALQEAGLTGTYNGAPTMQREGMSFDQGMQNRRFGLDERQTNASIGNMGADNARANEATALAREKFNLEKSQPSTAEQKALAAREQKMTSEKQGLINALRSGDVTPYQARKTIEEDLRYGFYTKEEAREMIQLIDIRTDTGHPQTVFSGGR